MTSVGLVRDEKHNYYWNGGPALPGVTGLIDAADDKEGLIVWAKREVAACSIRNFDFLQDLVSRGGTDNAINWLSRIPDYQRDTAGNLGTRIHYLAEQVARGASPDMTEEERPFVEGYRNFLAAYEPAWESLEQRVVNLSEGYGGTYDAIARINGERLLLDIKTSRTLQPKIALQLAAYANAEFVGRENDPHKYGAKKLGLESFDGFGVIHVRPDLYANGYRLVRYLVGPDEWEAFLHAKWLSRWRKTSKNVVGESIAAPVKEIAA